MQQGNVAVQVIDALAAKLAVPASQLWAVLIRQVPVEVGKDVVWLLVCAVAIYGCIRVWRFLAAAGTYRYDEAKMGMVLVSVVVAIAVTLSLYSAITDIGYLFNPQYFALNEILSALKK